LAPEISGLLGPPIGYGTYVGAQFLRATLTVVVPSSFGIVETTGHA
jgi:hypothetical protein